MASVVPRPAKPARQTFRNRLRSPATPSLQSAPTNCFVAPAPPTFAAPALPAAARHSHYWPDATPSPFSPTRDKVSGRT